MARFLLGLILGALLVGVVAFAPHRSSVPPLHSAPRYDFASMLFHFQRETDANQPTGAVVFLGDSLTQSMATANVPLAVNYAIGGQRTDELLQRLPHYHAIDRARCVVLVIGTNDVIQGREAGIERRLRAISQAIRAPLVWGLIPPMRDYRTDAVNASVRVVCAQRPDCTLVESGLTLDNLQDDGIHVTAAANQRWLARLTQGTVAK